MRRVSVFIISVFLLTTFFSCSKNNGNSTANQSSTTWTVDGKNYSVKNIERNDASRGFRLIVYADGYIQVNFASIPVMSGSYKIV